MEASNSKPRKCKCCNDLLYGRKDQIFCSTSCRNSWHNDDRSLREAIIRDTNRVLKKNWKILCQLNRAGKTKISKLQLVSREFDFRLITSTLTTREKREYRFCYDQGYPQLDDTTYLLVVADSGS